jgi:transcription factor SPN1
MDISENPEPPKTTNENHQNKESLITPKPITSTEQKPKPISSEENIKNKKEKDSVSIKQKEKEIHNEKEIHKEKNIHKEIHKEKNIQKEKHKESKLDDNTNTLDKNHYLSRYARMKVTKAKKKTREDYQDIVITLKERLSAAIKADRERVMQGKFSAEKLKLIPKLIEKLGNKMLSLKFLDMQGLDLLGEMIYKFPNGEFPSANMRNNVLKIIRNLPVEREHVLRTKVGGFLTYLEKKKDEILENKKIASEIKQKWTRVILNENIDYTMLQDEQHELTQAYLKKRSMMDGFQSNVMKREKRRRKGSEEEKDALAPRKNFRRTSYGFLVMPKSDKMTKKYKKMKEKEKMEKEKMRKRNKGNRSSGKKRDKHRDKDKQGLDVGEDSP